jgi:hypothetical protein
MSEYRNELKLAAIWIRNRVEQDRVLTDSEAAEHWQRLMTSLDTECRSEGSRLLTILQWREDMAMLLSSRLLHSPLEKAS